MKNEKRTIFCGVEDMDGNSVKLTEEQKKRFIESFSDGGKNNVIVCDDDSIPKTMKAIAAMKMKS
jgi:hypothetical protein